jgi:hypothetical protein
MDWNGMETVIISWDWSTVLGLLEGSRSPTRWVGGGGGAESFPYIDLGVECSVLCMSDIILFSEIPQIPLGSQHKINNM